MSDKNLIEHVSLGESAIPGTTTLTRGSERYVVQGAILAFDNAVGERHAIFLPPESIDPLIAELAEIRETYPTRSSEQLEAQGFDFSDDNDPEEGAE